MRSGGLILGLLLVGAASSASDDGEARRDAAERARAQVREKLEANERGLHGRVRALYKLSAFGDLPHWVGGKDATEGTLLRRGAARRVILRDLEERRLLRAELAAVDADLDRLARDEAHERELLAARPREGSLTTPTSGRIVASFGPYTDPTTHVRLFRRGVELSTPDSTIVAAAAGRVLWAGPLRGLGMTVVVDHGQALTTITSGLTLVAVAPGDALAAGTAIGQAVKGERVTLEVRRANHPIDPYPLLRAHHRP